ncbi:hypothetical protein DPMN_126389 [Dreissena polymorpha]|uniref:Uncharacterized protein n=1 Tax=Dreissena polymorpha TaxID=45954 RepID=A0A9D4H391_DREPO|nr:hypothetical protein DPMN_126389 [Dreissena polymorpha]
MKTIFKLNHHIQETNVLIEFHEDWTKNVPSRLLTFFSLYTYSENCPSPGGYVFQMIMTIFQLVRDIHKTNANSVTSRVFTKNVTSRAFTCLHYIHIEKTAPPLGGHVFFTDLDHFQTRLTKFHEDWANIMTFRVFTKFLYSHIWKTAPPPGGHTSTVFTSFELGQGTIGTNVLTKFHEDWSRNVASRVFTRQNVDDK